MSRLLRGELHESESNGLALAELSRSRGGWDAPCGQDVKDPRVKEAMREVTENARLVVKGADSTALLMRLAGRVGLDDPGPVSLSLDREFPPQFSAN